MLRMRLVWPHEERLPDDAEEGLGADSSREEGSQGQEWIQAEIGAG